MKVAGDHAHSSRGKSRRVQGVVCDKACEVGTGGDNYDTPF